MHIRKMTATMIANQIMLMTETATMMKILMTEITIMMNILMTERMIMVKMMMLMKI